MDNLTLSMVIPVYNVEKYIRSTMDSIVIMRTDLFNFEVIVVDDGTPDNSIKIVEEYKDRIDNLLIVHQENQGLSVARNTGLRYAKGDLVWFIDSDDTITPNAIDVISEVIKTEADIYAFDMYKVHEGETVKVIESMITRYKNFKYYGNAHLGTSLYGKIHYGAAPKNIFKRQFLEQNNLRFYPGIFFEDIEFLIRAQICAKKIVPVHTPIYCYLLRGNGSIMTSLRVKHLKDLMTVVENFKRFYTSEAKSNKERAIMGDAIFRMAYTALGWNENKIVGYNNFMRSHSQALRYDAVTFGLKSLYYFKIEKVVKILLCAIAPLSLISFNEKKGR